MHFLPVLRCSPTLHCLLWTRSTRCPTSVREARPTRTRTHRVDQRKSLLRQGLTGSEADRSLAVVGLEIVCALVAPGVRIPPSPLNSTVIRALSGTICE